MEGLEIRLNGDHEPLNRSNPMSLLAKHGDIEIITQYIGTCAVAWLEPADNPDAFEYYYVLSGELELEVSANDKRRLRPGDSFSLHQLKQNVMMKCIQEATVLYVSSTPVYSGVSWWQDHLMEQLKRINDTDHYTEHHSRAVMEYSVALFNELREYCPDVEVNDFVMGCLLHDIGKCNIPLEILNKPGRLTDDEFRVIKGHPNESQKMLEPLFNATIADLAFKHHERLDGSGYPNHLKAEEIPFTARILMVADSFDAMTRDRVYRKAVSMADAADELYHMPDQYDRRVTEALVRLVSENRLNKYQE